MKKSALIILPFLLLPGCAANHKADAYGSFEADEIFVSAEVNGTIFSFKKSEGETVQKGDLIAVIDTTTYALNLQEVEKALAMLTLKIKSAQQQLQILQTEKNNAEIDRQRFVNLIAQNAAPQKQLDDIDAALRVLDERIQQAGTNVKLSQKEFETNHVKQAQAKLLLGKCFVKAFRAGTILQIYSTAGEFTAAGKPLFKLADISRMKAIFYVSEPQLAGLKLGDELKVYIDANESMKKFIGTLTFISAEAEFTPKTIQTKDERVKLVYKAEASVTNDGSIKIGMPLEVRF